jgi:hypothetical protein
MIEQGRLVGRIDQLDGIVWFEGGEASGEKGSGRAEQIVGKEMRRWDANVESLAQDVENVTNTLQREFPVSVHDAFDSTRHWANFLSTRNSWPQISLHDDNQHGISLHMAFGRAKVSRVFVSNPRHSVKIRWSLDSHCQRGQRLFQVFLPDNHVPLGKVPRIARLFFIELVVSGGFG